MIQIKINKTDTHFNMTVNGHAELNKEACGAVSILCISFSDTVMKYIDAGSLKYCKFKVDHPGNLEIEITLPKCSYKNEISAHAIIEMLINGFISIEKEFCQDLHVDITVDKKQE